ncbi:hypothetical protein HK405_014598 [Cladochytrium tenue]|nr:hypothetical protein HK405_014598 [Cladochytrium tenue]
MSSSGANERTIVVFISGFGSNLQALIDAQGTPRMPNTRIGLVVSNRSGVHGLKRAESAGIPTLVFALKPYRDAGRSRVDYDRDLAAAVHTRLQGEPALVVLAGFMHILSADFISAFPCGIVNLHPALPGAFDGAHAIERAFAAFQEGRVDLTGIMVHWVIPEVDRGEVILSKEIPILPSDTLETLEERIHKEEHHLIVEGVRVALENKSVV